MNLGGLDLELLRMFQLFQVAEEDLLALGLYVFVCMYVFHFECVCVFRYACF